ncbi:hypothetical protein GGS23DRAFT_463535 [Durotheca rogersii]|uniref:uncharacterized protein n=1 Tax=Durotheca rogersii TaxID=419775 RepID=UPI00221EFC2E|nr:uncharacterized protein GGS23DRAFT_463535 [Durotheca rogersii]KAI5864789.1 hypothetical protein GGS23DRAFT_463535 [Durotheca rogersii]
MPPVWSEEEVFPQSSPGVDKVPTDRSRDEGRQTYERARTQSRTHAYHLWQFLGVPTVVIIFIPLLALPFSLPLIRVLPFFSCGCLCRDSSSMACSALLHASTLQSVRLQRNAIVISYHSRRPACSCSSLSAGGNRHGAQPVTTQISSHTHASLSPQLRLALF